MIALSGASVLISGDTGTGKELVAQSLHNESHRRDKALTTINCAALPVESSEVDLFGQADAQGNILHKGRLLAADGATVFLDEVDALPMSVQAKLLRFIEAGECQLQGSHKLHHADVRIIAATSTDLQAAVEAGSFRADLFYRLRVVPIELPSLTERVEDILLLLKHFSREYADKNAVVRLSKEVEQCLLAYSWPGNVREVANFCQQMALMNPGKQLQKIDLPIEMQPETVAGSQHFILPASGIDLAQVELSLIEQALDMAAGNRSKAARLLGISRDTLLYRMQKYNLTP
jgi:DNA-binding NtrC family response regulator